MQLEICVDSLESAIAAQAGGAQRVELCAALSEAGLTPSLSLLRAIRRRIAIGLHVMIRPRGGDFLYSEDEVAVMREDILLARENGVDGVVFGLLTRDGDVDVHRASELVKTARPMEVTFHRAIDMARDFDSAVGDVLQTGANRLLTSGGSQSALAGANNIERTLRKYGDAIEIMVCGGIRADNVAEIARRTGAVQFHAVLRREVGSAMVYRPHSLHLGASAGDDFSRKVAEPEEVKKLRQAMDDLANR